MADSPLDSQGGDEGHGARSDDLSVVDVATVRPQEAAYRIDTQSDCGPMDAALWVAPALRGGEAGGLILLRWGSMSAEVQIYFRQRRRGWRLGKVEKTSFGRIAHPRIAVKIGKIRKFISDSGKPELRSSQGRIASR